MASVVKPASTSIQPADRRARTEAGLPGCWLAWARRACAAAGAPWKLAVVTLARSCASAGSRGTGSTQ